MSRTIFYGRKDTQVTTQPNIGLDASARQSVIEMLNRILADEFVLSLKTQRTDGHAGLGISELKLIFDAQYKQLQAITDDIKERIQILGGSFTNNSEELMDAARLDGNVVEDPIIISILADQEAFIRLLREDARKCAEVYKDQGTTALLIDILRNHEKMAWVLRSNTISEKFENEKIV